MARGEEFLKPEDVIFKLDAIAEACGVSKSTLQRRLRALRIRLPKWGRGGRTAVVYVVKTHVSILKSRVLRSKR